MERVSFIRKISKKKIINTNGLDRWALYNLHKTTKKASSFQLAFFYQTILFQYQLMVNFLSLTKEKFSVGKEVRGNFLVKGLGFFLTYGDTALVY